MSNQIKSIIKLIGVFYLAALLIACGGGQTSESDASVNSLANSSGVQTSTSATSSATGAVTLSWMPPTENTDGSVLTDLSAYKIFYGTSPDSLALSIKLDNAGLTSYVIEDLTADTVYYFAITAVNSSDIQSGYSNIANKNITG